MELQTRRRLLQDIQAIASNIYTTLDKSHPNLSARRATLLTPKLPIPDLVLPPHDDILTPLSTMSVSKQTLDAIMSSLNQRISQLQQLYLSSYRRSCIDGAKGSHEGDGYQAVHQLYQNMSQTHYLPMIKSWVTFTLNSVAKHRQVTQPPKVSFNSDFTPILEIYFQYNGYPSPSHRTILAHQSGMTLRQIEVWFQNHRKRSRQDGKVVPRLDSDIPIKRALGALPKIQPNQTHTPNLSVRESTDEIVKPQQHIEQNVQSALESDFRPPNAFPTPWSTNSFDPFPADNGVYRFPPPVWRRTSATTPIIPTAVDIDDLARQFHMRLNFVENPWNRGGTPPKLDVPSVTPWFAPLQTIPASAPLPALHRPSTSVTISTSILTSTIAKDPYTFVFPNLEELEEREKSNVTCIVRLPVGPQHSASSISERIDRSVDALDQECKGFKMRRRALQSLRPSIPHHASASELGGRKRPLTSRRGPSSLQTFGLRTSSFTSDTSSSSDDSPSPSTPPPLPSHCLQSDQVVESDDLATDFNSFFEVPSSPSFDFTFSKSSTDTQRSSPQPSDFTLTNPVHNNSQSLSPRAFDLTFSTSPVLHQNRTPLIFT